MNMDMDTDKDMYMDMDMDMAMDMDMDMDMDKNMDMGIDMNVDMEMEIHYWPGELGRFHTLISWPSVRSNELRPAKVFFSRSYIASTKLIACL